MPARNEAVRWRVWLSITAILLALLANCATANDGGTYYFSGAVQIVGYNSNNEQPAVQAQCPSDHPTSCNSIGAPYWCCQSGYTCAWSNSQVACCPSGQSCSGAVGGVGGYQPLSSTWYPTTTYNTWQPTTQYYAQTTAYNGGGGVVVPAGYTQGNTQGYYGNGQYCSTLVEVGPNLPTTAAGECGTILIVAPAAGSKEAMGWAKLVAMVGGLQILGWVLLARR